MKIWKVLIQDRENQYEEWAKTKPCADYVDGFLRAVKDIQEFKVTQVELTTLEKFGVV